MERGRGIICKLVPCKSRQQHRPFATSRRPPRIVVTVRHEAAVVHFERVRVWVAVDRPRWQKVAAEGRMVVHADRESRPVERHVDVPLRVRCNCCNHTGTTQKQNPSHRYIVINQPINQSIKVFHSGRSNLNHCEVH